MKYEYQDVIVNELLKQIGSEIDEKSLEGATFKVYDYKFGLFTPNQEYIKKHNSPIIHMSVAKGCILDVFDKNGSEYDIDYIVYEFMYPVGYNNHTLCYLEIK